MANPSPGKLRPAASAVLIQGDRRWAGRLAPPISGGPPQLAFAIDDGPARLPLGSVVQLEVTAPRAESPRGSSARLTAVAYLPSVVLVEVDAENPSLWIGAMPGDVGHPADQRQWPRLAPPSTDPGPATVEIDVGPASARRFSARIVDRSSEGVGLRFVLQAEQFLCQSRSQIVDLPAFQDTPAGRYRLQVRHRRLLSTGVRYGLQVAGPVDAPERESHAAQWTCLGCGQQPLLADRHTHCLACGTARGNAPSRLPDWEDGVSERDHLFSGIAHVCLRCGCAWSEEARNCGHCGTRLPLSQTR
ncbi:MAG: hypothetical protein AAF602_10470 [Myxococcota bacterium]